MAWSSSTSSRLLALGAVALGTSGCGFFGGNGLPTSPLPEGGDTVMVMLAARDLYPGVSIAEEDLVAIEIQPAYLPEGVYLTPGHVVGQVPRQRILANEFIRAERLNNPEARTSLAAIVPRGARLYDVPISTSAPPYRTRVDVWWTPPGGAPCVAVHDAFVAGFPDGSPPTDGRIHLITRHEDAALVERAAQSKTVRFAIKNDTDGTEEGPLCSR